MSLTEEPYYLKRDCSPMCDHQMECARCGSPKCIKSMHHSRLYGYTCNCGSQEWKPVFEFSNQGSGLTKRALDGAVCACEKPLYRRRGYRFLCVHCKKPPRQ